MLRGIDFNAPVTIKKDVAGAMGNKSSSALREKYGAGGVFQRYEIILNAFGILDENSEAALSAVSKDQSRAFYSPEENAVYFATDMDTPRWNSPLIKRTMDQLQMVEEQFVLSRELSTALISQNYRDALSSGPEESLDGRMAKLAVADGGTLLLASQYLVRETGLNIMMLPNPQTIMGQFLPLVSYVREETLSALPAQLSDALSFTYTKGLDFVFQQKKTGGDMLLNAACSFPPTSTEQILHPEKYYEKRDNPVSISMPDVSVALEGSESMLSDSLGEYGLYLILSSWLRDNAEAKSAVSGWGGDRISIYAMPSGEKAIALFTTWDGAEQAEMFESVFSRASRAGVKDKYAISIKRVGRDVAILLAPKSVDVEGAMAILQQSQKIPVVTPPPVPEKPDPEFMVTDVRAFVNMFMEKSSLAPPSDDTWEEDGDVFRNRRFGYEVTRPGAQWHFEKVNLGGMFLSEFSAINTDVPGSNFTIFTFDRYEPGAPYNPVDDLVDFMGKQMQGFTNLGEKKVTVAGMPARMVSFSGSVFVPLTISYTEVFGPDHCYIITFWAIKTSYGKLLPEFESFRDSFRIIKD